MLHSFVRQDLKTCIVFPLATCSLEDVLYAMAFKHLYHVELIPDWLLQVAAAFVHIHSKQVIHFDLKPSNILVQLNTSANKAEMTLKIIDFATSYQLGSLNSDVTSTPHYTAPEILTAKESDLTEKVDVFAFGVVYWELLHRRIPFGRSAKVIDVLNRISTLKMPVFDEQLEIPLSKQHLIHSCWKLHPADRPSFSELETSLSTCL